MNGAWLLQGMFDAGVKALPHLRCVEFEELVIDYLSPTFLARFLKRFPRVEIDILSLNLYIDDVEERQFIFIFAAFPRVNLYCEVDGPTAEPPNLDDEDENEFEEDGWTVPVVNDPCLNAPSDQEEGEEDEEEGDF